MPTAPPPPTPRDLALLLPCVLSGVRSKMAPVWSFWRPGLGKSGVGSELWDNGDGDRRSRFSQGRARLAQVLPLVTWVAVQCA